jgi:23S rRNA (guanosine2251-2'-O)-methyltransferase
VDVLYGIHAVEEALKAQARPLEYIAMARERQDARLQRIVEAARAAGVPLRFMPRDQLQRLAQLSGDERHQGVVAVVGGKRYADLDSVIAAKKGEHHFLLVLDGIEDPHNLGALLRTADGAGADGVVIPERRSAAVTGTVAKASAGASEHVRVARVTNINRVLEELKQRNIWIVGLDERAKQDYFELDYRMDCAVVLGAEGAGLHEVVRRHCDYLVRIPMQGKVASLNVSVAGAVIMYEVLRQRMQPQEKGEEKAARRKKGLGS